jgi:sugar lactone lactonase YvrE
MFYLVLMNGLAYGANYKVKLDPYPYYEVEASWPKKPTEFVWNMMPGVYVDKKDNVWCVNRSSIPVQVYAPDGKLICSWDTDIFDGIHFLKVTPDGNVWVANTDKHVVHKFTPKGKLLMTIGVPSEKGCDQAHFNKPTDMAISSSGDIFVADGYGNSRVVRFDKNGKYITEWGRFGQRPGEFDVVHGIVIDSKGLVYIADRNNGRIQVFDQQGKFLDQWTNILVPWGICITEGDEIWSCGSSPMPMANEGSAAGWRGIPPKDQIVVKFDTSGKVKQLWTVPLCAEGQESPGYVNYIHGIAVDSKNNFYLCDLKGKRVQKFVRKLQ